MMGKTQTQGEPDPATGRRAALRTRVSDETHSCSEKAETCSATTCQARTHTEQENRQPGESVGTRLVRQRWSWMEVDRETRRKRTEKTGPQGPRRDVERTPSHGEALDPPGRVSTKQNAAELLQPEKERRSLAAEQTPLR